jgi:hypothetical protein
MQRRACAAPLFALALGAFSGPAALAQDAKPEKNPLPERYLKSR